MVGGSLPVSFTNWGCVRVLIIAFDRLVNPWVLLTVQERDEEQVLFFLGGKRHSIVTGPSRYHQYTEFDPMVTVRREVAKQTRDVLNPDWLKLNNASTQYLHQLGRTLVYVSVIHRTDKCFWTIDKQYAELPPMHRRRGGAQKLLWLPLFEVERRVQARVMHKYTGSIWTGARASVYSGMATCLAQIPARRHQPTEEHHVQHVDAQSPVEHGQEEESEVKEEEKEMAAPRVDLHERGMSRRVLQELTTSAVLTVPKEQGRSVASATTTEPRRNGDHELRPYHCSCCGQDRRNIRTCPISGQHHADAHVVGRSAPSPPSSDKGEAEHDRRSYRCSQCGQEGRNKRTCSYKCPWCRKARHSKEVCCAYETVPIHDDDSDDVDIVTVQMQSVRVA